MTSSYKKLFTVKVEHTFYRNMVSREDVVFIPTRECRKFMESNRMLFRKNPDGGIAVLYRTEAENSSTPFIDFDQNTYAFGLSLNDKARFLNITNLKDTFNNKDYISSRIIHITNDGTTQLLKYELLDSLRPAVFTYDFTFAAPAGGAATGKLQIKDKNNVIILDQENIVKDANGVYHVSLDLAKEPKGKYTFLYSDAANLTPKQETVYLDNDLAGQGVFGVLEITDTLAGFASLLTQPTFIMRFSRMETLWRYYIVLKSGQISNTDTLEIADIAGDDTNSAYAEFTFAPDGSTTLNGLYAFKFISDQLIPFFEEPKMDLKLRKTNSPAKTLMQDLPNPLAAGTVTDYTTTDLIPVSEVFVYV
jgi:hypothetical protein